MSPRSTIDKNYIKYHRDPPPLRVRPSISWRQRPFKGPSPALARATNIQERQNQRISRT